MRCLSAGVGLWCLGGAACIGLCVGFALGYQWFARRMRHKFGGVRVY